MREVPFSFIQFPLWEAMKKTAAAHSTQTSNGSNSHINPFLSAAFGSFSGAIAAFLTTPLDVIKTRLMLDVEPEEGMARSQVTHTNKQGHTPLLTLVKSLREESVREHGNPVRIFFRGVGPRVLWIGIGGIGPLG